MFFEILDQRLIYFSHGRVLSKEGFIEYFAKLDAMSEKEQGKYNFFVDHSHIERVEISIDEYRNWAINRQKIYKDSPPCKVAVYSSQKLGFGMARMYQSLRPDGEAAPVQLEVFDDLEKALAWLDVSSLKKRILSLNKRAAIPLRAVERDQT
jgi:hypothetical protein